MLFVIGVGLYWHSTTHANLSIKVDIGHSANFRVYWINEIGQSYNDENSSKVRINAHRQHYSLKIANLRNVKQLRIDPISTEGLLRIHSLKFQQSGLEDIELKEQSLDQLKPLQQVANISIGDEGLVYYATDFDSSFLYDVTTTSEPDLWLTHLLRVLGILALSLLLLRLYPAAKLNTLIPYAMGLVLVLVVIMATISRPHSHPDEHAHLRAAQYYDDHVLPPQACAPSTLYTYTNYGTSRLNADELAYFIGGRYLELVEFLPFKPYHKLRFFNVALFALLLLLAIAKSQARLLFVPLLFSPQIWYLFSYFNSDALALFFALIIGHQVADNESVFRRLISGQATKPALAILGLGILALFLFLTKKNYYFFTLFLFASATLLAWQHRQQLDQIWRAAKPSALILTLGISLFGSWHLYQNQQHDFNRKQQVLDCRQQTALPAYKPDAAPEVQHKYLNLKSQGTSLGKMLSMGWADSIFSSAFGNYGYVELPASPQHYLLVKALLLGIVLILIWQVITRGSNFQRLIILLNLGLFVCLIAITMYKSWTVDYQPQGRYYFAMAPIFGLSLVWLRNLLDDRLFKALVLGLFALAVVSFTFIGLLHIPKGFG